MAKPLLLVDFDRTLFDTGRFIKRLWATIAEIYGVDAKLEEERGKSFYRYSGDWYDYDFFDHIASIDAITDTKDMFCERIHQALRDDFLYEDVVDILPIIDTIVTFGNAPYQRFKLEFCPSLAEISTQIITSDKGEFIAKQYEGLSVVLVDDKHLEHQLPSTATFILLDRMQKQPIVSREGYISVNSLREVRSLHDKNGYATMRTS